MEYFPPPTSVSSTLYSTLTSQSARQDSHLPTALEDDINCISPIPDQDGADVEALHMFCRPTYHETLQHRHRHQHNPGHMSSGVEVNGRHHPVIEPLKTDFQATEGGASSRAYLSPVSNTKSPSMASDHMPLPYQGSGQSQQWMMMSPAGDEDGQTTSYPASTPGSSYVDEDGSELYQLCTGPIALQSNDTPASSSSPWSCTPHLDVPPTQTAHYYSATNASFANGYDQYVTPSSTSWLSCPSAPFVAQAFSQGFPHYQTPNLPCPVFDAPTRSSNHLYGGVGSSHAGESSQSDSAVLRQQSKNSGNHGNTFPRGVCPRQAAAAAAAGTAASTPAALLKKSLACKSCNRKFSSQEERDQHDAECSALPCLFAFAGCPSRCKGKNEWKRHINTQHLLSTSFQCIECSEKVFNRKDLFTQHYLRMHATKDEQEAAKARRPLPAFEQRLRYKQKDAERRDHWQMPTAPRCLVRDCDSTFLGSDSWDKCLEHVSKHLGTAGGAGKHHQETLDQHSFTTEQLDYFVNVGAIEKVDDGFVLGRQSDGQRARTNKRKNKSNGSGSGSGSGNNVSSISSASSASSARGGTSGRVGIANEATPSSSNKRLKFRRPAGDV